MRVLQGPDPEMSQTMEVKLEEIGNLNTVASLIEPVVVVQDESQSESTSPPSPCIIPLTNPRPQLADPSGQAVFSSFAAFVPRPPSVPPPVVAYGPRPPSVPPPKNFAKTLRKPPWRQGKHYHQNVARRDAMTPAERANDRARRRAKTTEAKAATATTGKGYTTTTTTGGTTTTTVSTTTSTPSSSAY